MTFADAGTSPARRIPTKVWLPVGVVVALLAGLLTWDLTTAHRAPYNVTSSIPRIAAGSTAPDFSLPRLGGGAPVSLASYRGTPVVLNFFASWCRTCRGELRAFATASRDAGRAVDFVGIDTQETSPKTAEALLARAGATYPVAVDAHGTEANAYVVEALPTTVFVGRSGTIAGIHIGAETVAGLHSWFSRLSAGSG